MPRLVNFEGQQWVEVSRDEAFNFFLNTGRGVEWAERMTRNLFCNHSSIRFGEVTCFQKAEQLKSSGEFHTTSLAEENFLKAYMEEKSFPKWWGKKQSWRKKKQELGKICSK